MISLQDRVARHTIEGDPAECWGWSASCLPNGRPRLGLRHVGLPGSVTVARVIAHLATGLPLKDDEGERWVARHTCDNVACVNPAHIITGTYKENTGDMWGRGRGARGDRRPSSKLSIEKVRDIRARLATGESQSSIARDLGTSQGNISQVARGKIWSWVE